MAHSTGRHDPLLASLLALSTPESAVAWVTIDCLGVDTWLAGRIRQAVGAELSIDPRSVLVSASHTHSGPLAWTGGLYPGDPGERDDEAADRLLAAISSLAASTRWTEAVPWWSAVPVHGVGGNRLIDDGPYDPTAGVLALRNEAGVVRCVLYDLACHPTVLGDDNLRWSADWPGATRSLLSAALRAERAFAADTEGDSDDGEPVIAFLQGPAGDASARRTRRSRGFGEVARLGGIVTGSLLSALAGESEPLPWSEWGLKVEHDRLTLPVRKWPSTDACHRLIRQLESLVAKMPAAEHTTPAGRRLVTQLQGAHRQLELARIDRPSSIELELTAVRLGPVAWFHCPVELFGSIGGMIRLASPFPSTRIIGYTNGYHGYLADPAAHRDGGYEAISSLFDPAAGEVLTDAAGRLLGRLVAPDPAARQ